MYKNQRFVDTLSVICTKKAIICAYGLLLSLSCTAATFHGIVTKVQDGDTLTLTSGKTIHKVRLESIDAPELKQFYGYASRNSLSQLTLNKKATTVCSTKDIYKRDVCTVFVAKVDINSLQVERGMAWAYLHYAPKGTPLKGIQDKARESKLGLWSEADPEAPWAFRRAVKEAP